MLTKMYFLHVFKAPLFDLSIFTESVKTLLESHAMLRCKIIDSDVQKIEDTIEPNIEVLHYEHINLDTDIKKIKELAESIFKTSFEKNEIPLFKFIIIKVAKKQTVIMLCYRGIIIDGWSYEILMRDLEQIYSGRTVEKEAVFKKYVCFLTQRTTSQEYLEAKEYWKKQARLFPGPPEIPLLCDPSEIKNANSYTIFRTVPQNMVSEFSLAAAESGVTTFVLLLTLFAKAISLYSRKHRFVLNLPFSIRPSELNGINNAIGLFSDSMLFVFEDKICSILEMASLCQLKLMELQDYSSISSTEALKDIQKATGENVQAPIVFTSTLGLSNGSSEVFEKILARPQTSQMWIETLLTQCGDNILLSMTCIEGLISHEIAEGLADVFCEALIETAVNKKEFLKRKYLTPRRKDLLQINKLNATKTYGHLPCLTYFMSNSFERYADQLAVACGNVTLTYSQLYAKVCSLLYILRTKCSLISSKDRIGIFLEKGCEQIVCAATAICGNFGYMPIDPQLPADSIKDCMQKAGLKLLITDKSFVKNLETAGIFEYLIFGEMNLEDSPKDSNFVSALPDDISIIINTSGTTGAPKSICLYQKGLVNCLVHTKEIFAITNADRVLSVTNFSHDMAIFDTIGILICGGAVIVPLPDKQKEPSHWNELISNKRFQYGIQYPHLWKWRSLQILLIEVPPNN